MSDGSSIDSIVPVISGYLGGGITAGNDILFFAESTLGISDEGKIADLLAEPDMYGDGLCDLVFSPTMELREAVEPLIPPDGLDDTCINEITTRVLHAGEPVRIIIGSTCMTANFQLSPVIVMRFVEKLNMHKPVTVPGLDERAYAGRSRLCIRARVLIRNTSCRLSQRRVAFLDTMFSGMTSDNRFSDEYIIDCVTFITTLFGEENPDSDIYSAISRKRRVYEGILTGIERFSEYNARYSMEFMMSQRIQAPVENAETIRRFMDLADMICIAVFGRPADAGSFTR